MLLKLYDNAIKLTHTINQVHPYLLSNLKFPPDLYLSSVGLLSDEVVEVREKFLLGYQKALIPLKAYAAEYKIHIELYSLDVNKYIE